MPNIQIEYTAGDFAYENFWTVYNGINDEILLGNGSGGSYTDNTTATCPPEHDLAVSGIIHKSAVADKNVYPVVNISNTGLGLETDFTVLVTSSDGVYSSTKNLTGQAFVSGTTMEVTMDEAWTPAEGTQNLTATVTLTDDGNDDNDNMIIDFTAFIPSYTAGTIYGFDAYSPTNGLLDHVVEINMSDGVITDIAASNVEDIYCGDFVGENDDATIMGIFNSNNSIYYINGDGAVYHYGNITGNGADYYGGLTWHQATNVMYASDFYNLYKIYENLNSILICQIRPSAQIIGIACNIYGELFGLGLDDNLYSIDKNTGLGTLIGPIGINIYYAHDIGFAHDVLYGTLYDVDSNKGGLYTFDLTTGTETQVGSDMEDNYTGRYGVSMNYINGVSVQNNEVKNIFTSSSNYALKLENNTNVEFSGNNIHDIVYGGKRRKQL